MKRCNFPIKERHCLLIRQIPVTLMEEGGKEDKESQSVFESIGAS
jgi:hypothetical protein